MPANIAEVDGRAAMMYVGETPWHGLGQKLDAYATTEQAIRAAGLDKLLYEKVPAYHIDSSGKPRKVEGRFVIRRKDTELGLGTVGRQYKVVQIAEQFSFMDALIGEKAAVYETAGALNYGREVWALARVENVLVLPGGDELKGYLLIADDKTGRKKLRIRLTTVRVVCANTLGAAMGEAGQIIGLRHTKNIGMRVAEVREALGVVNKGFFELEQKMKAMCEKKLNVSGVETFFEALGFNPDSEIKGEKEIGQALLKAYETAPGQDLQSASGTLWGAVNAVTYYVDHARDWSVRAPKGKDASEVRFERIMFGKGEELKQKALELAGQMVTV